MLFPAILARGLPGKRVEAHRAGITASTIGYFDVGRWTLDNGRWTLDNGRHT